MATQAETLFLRQATDALADVARREVRPQIPSNTLRNAVEIRRKNARIVALYIPHYWALYLHDGRKGFGPRRASVLVWYFNPADDPRLKQGYPVRYRETKRLEPEQFREGLAKNRARRALGLPPFMIVRKYQPKPLFATPFFTQGMAKFARVTVPKLVPRYFSNFVRSEFGYYESQVARVRL